MAQIVAEFIGRGLTTNQPAIVVATAVQRAAILRALVMKSFDVVALQERSDLILLDAASMLGVFMKDDVPNRIAFNTTMRSVFDRACRGRPGLTVWIYGQMVDLLWQDGKREAAIRLELLWNRLAETTTFSLLCGYAIGHFYRGESDEVCRQHTHVISADGKAVAMAQSSDRR